MGTGRHQTWCNGLCFGRCSETPARDSRRSSDRRANRPIELQTRPAARTSAQTPGHRRSSTTPRASQTTPRASQATPRASQPAPRAEPPRTTPQHSRQSSAQATGQRSSGTHGRHSSGRASSGLAPQDPYIGGTIPSQQSSRRVSSDFPSGSGATPRSSGQNVSGQNVSGRTAEWLQEVSPALYRGGAGRTSGSSPRYSRDSRPRHSGDSRLRHSGDSRPRHSGEGPAPYDSGSGRSSGIVAPGPGDHLSTDPAAYQYGIHQMQGAYRQRWLQVDYAADCPFIMRSPLQYLEMINRTNPADRWSIDRNSFVQSPIGFDSELASQGLPSGPNTYRKIRLNGPVQWGVYNEYVHMTATGVIFAMDITRDSLYHWSDIAVGQYTMDFRIETLRRIYFHHVINEDTHGFMMDLYRSTMEGGFSRNPAAERQIIWSLGTPEYQAIMGTTFGKGVAALLLTYFPRGTVIVARVVTWRQQDLHMRFDIEPVSYMEGQ